MRARLLFILLSLSFFSTIPFWHRLLEFEHSYTDVEWDVDATAVELLTDETLSSISYFEVDLQIVSYINCRMYVDNWDEIDDKKL